MERDLEPDQTTKKKLTQEGRFTYTVTDKQRTHTGRVIVSETREPSGVHVILITNDGLEAPDPLIIGTNRFLFWTNERRRLVKVTFG